MGDTEPTEYVEVEYASTTLRPGHFTLLPTGFRLNEGMVAIEVRWSELTALRLVEPCPCFEVEWRHADGREQRRFEARFRDERSEVETAVLSLVEHVRTERPDALEPGWSAYPDVAWERVKRLPEAPSDEQHGEGVYRSTRVRSDERILATWGPPSPMGTMLQWLASTPDRPWRHHPKRVVLTEHFVYVEQRDGTFARLPKGLLRDRRGDDGMVYVFGRKTLLVLPESGDDDVSRALDRHIFHRRPM